MNDQDFPLGEVPAEARTSGASLYFVLFGFTFFTSTMFAGGQVGPSFAWSELLLVILAGNVILATYASVLAVIAFRSGLHTALMTRFCFGEWGSRGSDFLLGFTQIGWYAWGTATVSRLTVELLGLEVTFQALLIVFFGLIFCLTAYVGYRGLELLSRVSVPLMTCLLLWSALIASGEPSPAAPADGSLGLASALTIIVGTFVSGATVSTNWSRFAPTLRVAVGATLAAFLVGNGLMVLSGAYGAYVYGEPDIVKLLVRQGILGWALVMLFTNIWTTQDNTIYNFSVVGCTAFRVTNRRRMTVLGAVVGTALALGGMDEKLVPFLLGLGTVIPPLGGVIVADYFLVRQGSYPPLAQTVLPRFEWAGLAAYAVGVACALWTPGVPPLNGILGAILARWSLFLVHHRVQ